DQSTTVLDITMHGFYVQDVVMADGLTYQVISLAADQVPAAGDDGRPDLPALAILIGIPTDAVPSRNVQVTDVVTLGGYNIPPRPSPTPRGPPGSTWPPPSPWPRRSTTRPTRPTRPAAPRWAWARRLSPPSTSTPSPSPPPASSPPPPRSASATPPS